MQTTFIGANLSFLLIIVTVIAGLVVLVRSLPPGSGPKVALGVGGLLALLFIGYYRVSELRPDPMAGPRISPNFGNNPGFVSDSWSASSNQLSLTLLTPLIGLAVVVGIVLLINRMARLSGGRTTLVIGAIGLVLLTMFSVAFWSKDIAVKSGPVVVKSGSLTMNPPSAIDLSEMPKKSSEAAAVKPETTTFTPEANDPQPAKKPDWLMQGTQTGNGVSQFPISSELFQTVAECQKDLDRQMSALIAAEVRFLVGEEYPIALLPGEAQSLVAETYTEEFPITSNGTWYKVHRLIKIDQTTWAMFRSRFQEAQLHARLEKLGLSFGGLMVVLGVVYLLLRRKPRVVDPTLETFSTT